MIKEAQGFIERYTDERRLSAITALGRMKYTTLASARKSLSTLLNVLDNEPNDTLHANTMMAALEIVEKTDQISCDDIHSIVKQVCERPGSQTRYCCACALSRYAKALSEEVIVLLLNALYSLDPSHKITIQELDSGLGQLLDTSHANHSIEFVTKFLSSLENTLDLSEFQNFSRKLIDGPEDRFHRVFISWMLSGQPTLCHGLSKVLRDPKRSEKPLNLNLQELNLSPEEQIFLAKKAIGYFFLQPVISGSVLVSILRICDDNVARTIGNLLFDPLLLNYGGTLKDYLNAIDVKDLAYPYVQTALQENKLYLENIKSVGEIKELHPSEHERQIGRLCFNDHMRDEMRRAEKKSVFHGIVKRSVLLYGKRSITYVEGLKGERKPVEIELQKHTTMVELPRLEVIDPIGLDYMLRVFRVERLKS